VTGAAPATGTQHAGHLLLASAFVLVSLLGVALGEQLKVRRAARSPRPRRTSSSVLVVAASGAAAGAIHLAVAPSHWHQAAVYGAFFVLVGATQITWSALLLARASWELLSLNLLANLGVLLLWLQTRTSGVPLGPAAGVREPVGLVDLSCAAVELLSAAVAGRVLLRRRLRLRGLAVGPQAFCPPG
jgi:hypothetical protein